MSDRTGWPQPMDGYVTPRFAGPVTFMRLPVIEDASQLDIALLGVPFDLGTTNRAGARHGPREIRNMSSIIRRVNPATRVEPCRLVPRGRCRRHADQPGRPDDLAAHDRGPRGGDPRRRRLDAGAGRRPPGLPAHPARHRPGGAGPRAARHGAFRRAFRHQRQLFRRHAASPMARPSAARSRKGCSTRSASCRSASAARSSTWPTWTGRAAAGVRIIPIEEVRGAGSRRDHRRGAARGGRRARPT